MPHITNKNTLDLIEYWVESSDRDYKSMLKNYKAKQYLWALFIGHLMLEKLLKAIYVKNNKNKPYPPKIHNLNVLAEKCKLKLNDRQEKILFICNSFNINTRYGDYKNEFYKKCTRNYTKKQIKDIEEMRIWLRKELI